MPKNPRGFPERLKALMEGKGWDSRAVQRESGGKVSHSAVEAWLKDESRAGEDTLEKVAALFGWTVPELLYGHPSGDTMDRVAELEGALGQLRRALQAATAAADRALGVATPPPESPPRILETLVTEPRKTPRGGTVEGQAAQKKRTGGSG